MARYIDADELTRRIVYYHGHTNEGCGEHYAYGIALKEIDRTPTADVVEVVRCKDCRYWRSKNSKDTQGICACGDMDMNYGGEFYPFADDFCSYGERRTDNDV